MIFKIPVINVNKINKNIISYKSSPNHKKNKNRKFWQIQFIGIIDTSVGFGNNEEPLRLYAINVEINYSVSKEKTN